MSDTIHIRDKNWLHTKLWTFRRENTRVVADFDHTITTAGGPSSWSLLRKLPHFPEGYYAKYQALYEKYHGYETDETLDPTTWEWYMHAWWQENLDLFREYHMHADHLRTVDISSVHLRNGIREAFEFFDRSHIPLLILSAGIHQTIEMILDQEKLPETHRTIIANTLLFDREKQYAGVAPKEFIHVGNKEKQVLQKIQTIPSTEKRDKVILLGDHLKDITMIQAEEREHTIAIGFCNSINMHAFETYLTTFDIVVTSDTSDAGILAYLIDHIH